MTKAHPVLAEHEFELLDLLLTASGRPVTLLALFDRDDISDASQLARTRCAAGARGGVPQSPAAR